MIVQRHATAAELIAEGRLEVGDGYRAKNEELSRAGYPFARAGNVNNGFHFDGADYFPAETIARVGNKLSRPGDVVFTSKGTVGRFAFVDTSVETFVYSPQLCYWRSLDASLVDPRWLYYWMHGAEFQEQFRGVAKETDMAEYVSLQNQRRFTISIPPIDFQTRIASILGSLDDKIELNRRMNETLEAMARAIFRSWFVDFDPVKVKARGGDPTAELGLAPEIAALFPDSFQDSELGEIPEGWEVKGLDKLGEFLNGLAMQKFPSRPGSKSLPVIKIAELRRGVTEATDQASLDVPDAYVVGDGDLLFSWSGSLTLKYWTSGPGALNQHLFKVSSHEYPSWFLYHWIDEHLPEFASIAATKATTMGHINRSHLSQALCAVPSEKVVSEMNLFFEPMHELFIENELESRELTATRDYLLPLLLSGKIDVSGGVEEPPYLDAEYDALLDSVLDRIGSLKSETGTVDCSPLG